MFQSTDVDEEDVPDPLISQHENYEIKKRRTKSRKCINTAIVIGVLLIFIIVVIILVIVYWPASRQKSTVGHYAHAAVASDAAECSTIGKNILKQQGSAVDAAIASLLCLGILNTQSCGLGGGFFMIVYDVPHDGTTKELFTFDAREVAPIAATEDMFLHGASSKEGGKSIAVPGEVKGYYEAWKKFGHLPWKNLFQPSIELCEKGFKVGIPLSTYIKRDEAAIRNTSSLREIFVKEDGSLYKEGDIMKRTKLAATLKKIANDGDDFYYGSLAEDIVADIKDYDGIITLEDLKNYTVKMQKPLSMGLSQTGVTLHTLQPPSSGVLLGFMLRILEGYHLTPSDLDGTNQATETYHKIIESFKFGYALRTYLGDEKFENLTEIMKNLTSEDFVEYIRKNRLDLNHTHDIPYYHPQFPSTTDTGTSHLSILLRDGAAVSATTTINLVFGSKRRGNRTGIIFNDEMDDFLSPGKNTTLGRENYIKPRKRPMSSMCPAIFLDKNNNTVLVLGGSGGIKITSATAYVAAHNLWLGLEINDAINRLRLHHQLQPNRVEYEKGFSLRVLMELQKQKGHEVIEVPYTSRTSVVQGIHSTCHINNQAPDTESLCITAVSDWRKNGKPDGF